jgi:uncharacterized protein
MLVAMGLDEEPVRRTTKRSVLDAIRRMGVLQIDTIHVVARSPYLVLWSRLGDYEPRWLEELLAERKLFEYWSHEASFLPIESYPLYRRLMLDGRTRWKSTHEWVAGNRHIVDPLLERIRDGGPVRSADFERTDGRKGSWWDWKPEKIGLERLHTAGELMIAARQNFQRIYDLRERVNPEWDDAAAPPIEHVWREMALAAVRALGIAAAAWVPDYFRTRKNETVPALAALAAEGKLISVAIEGVKGTAYVHPDNSRLLARAAAGRLEPTATTLLSPFDPLVWDRARAQQLFDFEYRIECYTPAPKRKYGYFTLPILHRGELVGRLDPKAHRADGVFEVKSLHLEPGVVVEDVLVHDLAGALARLARWHQTPRVVIRDSAPKGAAKRLTAALRRL